MQYSIPSFEVHNSIEHGIIQEPFNSKKIYRITSHPPFTPVPDNQQSTFFFYYKFYLN